MHTGLWHRTLTVALAALVSACADDPAPSDAATVPDAAPVADAGTTADLDSATDGAASGDGVCPVVGYAPCGGELQGTWEFVSFCPEDLAAAAALFEHPYDDRPECQRADNPVQGSIATEGTLTITATEMQMKATRTIAVSYGFTDACLAVVPREPAEPAAVCAEMENGGRMSCSYDAARQPPCSCSATLPGEPVDESMVYEQTGETELSAGGGEARATFCVKDDLLTLDWDPHPISWRYWIVRRAP